MTTTTYLAPIGIVDRPTTSIVIYRHNGAGKMYLCADGSLCSDIKQAAHHWPSQFTAIIAEQWICTCGGIASFDFVGCL